MNRGEALAWLVKNWSKSERFNELRLLAGLRFEGKWENNPLQTRQTLLDFFSHIPPDTWWNIQSFINAIKQQKPDFQRTAGDYDTWYVIEEKSNTYLRGFQNWDLV